jgi:hypothetical protein
LHDFLFPEELGGRSREFKVAVRNQPRKEKTKRPKGNSEANKIGRIKVPLEVEKIQGMERSKIDRNLWKKRRHMLCYWLGDTPTQMVKFPRSLSKEKYFALGPKVYG